MTYPTEPDAVAATPTGMLGSTSPTHRTHHTQIRSAIQSIRAELGSQARGAVTDLTTRLANLDAANTVLTSVKRTASYTFVLADAGIQQESNHATNSLVFTIPLNATVAFPIGTVIPLRRYGAGALTIAGATGAVIIHSPGELRSFRVQYSAGSLRKDSTDEWELQGDLV